MNSENQLLFLRKVLFIKFGVTLLVWGVPTLIAPASFFNFLGVPFPNDPTFVRLFGALVTALALAYWYAWKDPLRNFAIIKFAVLDNGLAAVTIIVLAFIVGPNWFFLLSLLLILFFFGTFAAYLPILSKLE